MGACGHLFIPFHDSSNNVIRTGQLIPRAILQFVKRRYNQALIPAYASAQHGLFLRLYGLHRPSRCSLPAEAPIAPWRFLSQGTISSHPCGLYPQLP